MNEFDTIQLNVTGCFNAIYEMENVTIEEDKNPVIEWSADTSSYPDYLFQEWQIFRKDPGQPQYRILVRKGLRYYLLLDFYNKSRMRTSNPVRCQVWLFHLRT